MRGLRHREVERLVQDHTASIGRRLDAKPKALSRLPSLPVQKLAVHPYRLECALPETWNTMQPLKNTRWFCTNPSRMFSNAQCLRRCLGDALEPFPHPELKSPDLHLARNVFPIRQETSEISPTEIILKYRGDCLVCSKRIYTHSHVGSRTCLPRSPELSLSFPLSRGMVAAVPCH